MGYRVEAQVTDEASDDASDEATSPVDVSSLAPSFALPRVARIRASLDLEPERGDEILAASEVSDDQWDALEDLTDREIRARTRGGDTSLLARFDETYLGHVEVDRGEVTLVEHARLVVAEERGTVDDLASELGIPARALLRLGRVWQRKAATDAGIAHDLRRAVAEWRSR